MCFVYFKHVCLGKKWQSTDIWEAIQLSGGGAVQLISGYAIIKTDTQIISWDDRSELYFVIRLLLLFFLMDKLIWFVCNESINHPKLSHTFTMGINGTLDRRNFVRWWCDIKQILLHDVQLFAVKVSRNHTYSIVAPKKSHYHRFNYV